MYSQNKETITINLPKPKLAKSLTFGYVSPFRQSGSNYGYGLNAQVNAHVGSIIFIGGNYSYQHTASWSGFGGDNDYRLNLVGGDLGVNIPLKNDFSMSILSSMNYGILNPEANIKTKSMVYFLETSLKYRLTEKLKFVNKIQFGGGNFNWISKSVFNARDMDISYRTLNFLFGVEF